MESMDPMENGSDDFVTVVAVGNQTKIENFVTVLSIGAGKNDLACLSNGLENNLQEEVEVFRLPGERLGFGLKFEGGNKTSERVKRLFVQSCAEESPASRAKCSWGSLGEGDEILSIDGVPVMHMTRLDCVRRLKESQLVIKLLVRCRGALKPEVVSAERKSTPEKCKILPELPAAPPPVPPRKLRHTRGLADGEANPSPAAKILKNNSPSIHQSTNGRATGNNKSAVYDSCNSSPKTPNISRSESLKKLSKECSSDIVKSKQEPPEAMVYLDARSQDGSSTHGSTSDDTGSSMSTVVDRFSTSDRFSTTSTISTASEFPFDWSKERSDDQFEIEKQTRLNETSMNTVLESFAQLDHDFSINSSDYLLTRLANSEAVTYVESRGEAGAVVEKVTAVIAPNTVVIEETMTLQPPLSFQDAPLSYGHEARPGIFYTADLAADSTTHFRPIRDDVSIVECINGNGEFTNPSDVDLNNSNEPQVFSNAPPPLPMRNHVNCIPVNQKSSEILLIAVDSNNSNQNKSFDVNTQNISIPPKPLPRKEAKLKRKQLPPPPPPPPNTTPRRELPPPVPVRNLEISKSTITPLDGAVSDVNVVAISTSLLPESKESNEIGISSVCLNKNESIESSSSESFDIDQKQMNEKTIVNESQINDELNNSDNDGIIKEISTKCKEPLPIMVTNKVFEIIEMRKVKALYDSSKNKKNENIIENNTGAISLKNEITDELILKDDELITSIITPVPDINEELLEKKINNDTLSEDNVDASELNESLDEIISNENEQSNEISTEHDNFIDTEEFQELNISEQNKVEHVDIENSYQPIDPIINDVEDSKSNSAINEEDQTQDESESSSDSDCDENDYYWQSNLATIGEEEETPSLEYIGINNQVNEIDSSADDTVKQSHTSIANETNGFNMNAGERERHGQRDAKGLRRDRKAVYIPQSGVITDKSDR
ncbi:hypothetical protein PV327_008228 [Microctonus hyperodae]|uniref:PDZ domain-containing protein n=1 Tax=Microctonus hyperodae TaxID=165561 RepID=A0AA39KH01_MICHY|nr:hypothetical protein PV327_008228 [Microctonus hyperodae]